MPHLYICDYHKNMIQRVRTKRKRKDSLDGRGSPDHDDDFPDVSSFLEIRDALPETEILGKLSSAKEKMTCMIADEETAIHSVSELFLCHFWK